MVVVVGLRRARGGISGGLPYQYSQLYWQHRFSVRAAVCSYIQRNNCDRNDLTHN